MAEGRYRTVYNILKETIPENQLHINPLYRYATSVDAGIYDIIPRLVVRVENESQVTSVLHYCRRLGVPVTFRGGGHSLSGQAVSDSVIMEVMPSWNSCVVNDDGSVLVSCGLRTGAMQETLASHNRWLPLPHELPDTASVAGIVADDIHLLRNSRISSFIRNIRCILPDGSVYDTRSDTADSKIEDIHSSLKSLSEKIKASSSLLQRVNKRFALPGSTGYRLDRLIEKDTPALADLIAGSEGTLAFISEIEFNTLPLPPVRKLLLHHFNNESSAFETAFAFFDVPGAYPTLYDRYVIPSGTTPIPVNTGEKKGDQSILATTIHADSMEEMEERLRTLGKIANTHQGVSTDEVSDSVPPERFVNRFFSMMAVSRKRGTLLMPGSIAVPHENLIDMVKRLRGFLKVYNFEDTVLWGPVGDGILYYALSADFTEKKFKENYRQFMDALSSIVIDTYNGSIRPAFGTGHAMAPYLPLEWDAESIAIMKELKKTCDPESLFSPGIIIGEHSRRELEHLKKPVTEDSLIERCSGCGVCEDTCPSGPECLSTRHLITIYHHVKTMLQDQEMIKDLKSIKRDITAMTEKGCSYPADCSDACSAEIDPGEVLQDIITLLKPVKTGGFFSIFQR